MTQMRLTDEQESRLSRQVDEFKFRVRKRTLPFDSSMDVLQRIIEGETAFPIWKTITVGTHKSGKTLLATLKREGFRISAGVEDILTQKSFPVSPKRENVGLVVATGYELGFTEAAPLSDIIAAGERKGLLRCQPEGGPQLRRKHADQSKGKWLTMAMEPITGADDGPDVFGVVCGDHGLWLDARWGGFGAFWGPGNALVFRSPQR